jgi:2-polyprenyl-3-methyl-5-hydroxy-6-metoxy-1,4-benzoquinol methylase
MPGGLTIGPGEGTLGMHYQIKPVSTIPQITIDHICVKHMSQAFDRAYSLIKYKSDDPFGDAVAELSHVVGIGPSKSRELVTATISGSTSELTDDSSCSTQDSIHRRALNSFIVHLTQSIRIPYMTERFSWYLDVLNALGVNQGSCLDYGGGGGKDSILLSRHGMDVHYCDLLSHPLTGFIASRFAIRDLEVPIFDVRELGSRRYNLINCQDVIEHCYDIELVLADISAHLTDGGILLMAPTFTFEFNNDHLDKNTAYLGFFNELCACAGLELIAQMNWNTIVFRRLKRGEAEALSVDKEKSTVASALYKLTQSISLQSATKALDRVYASRQLNADDLNAITDNLAVYRICCHRLK